MTVETESIEDKSSPSLASTMELDAVVRRAERLYEQGYLEAARQVVLEVLTRRPDHVQALLTLAHILRETGSFDDALGILGRIGELSPGHINAHAAYALTLFFQEDWTRAWRAFDVRFKFPDVVPRVTLSRTDGTKFAAAPWSEGPPPSSLLVMGEQGLGDTIHFARFLPLLAATGIKATCAVQKKLLRLLASSDAGVTFVPIEEGGGSIAGVTGWTPLLHLPRALGIGPNNFVPRMPYLKAEPDRVAHWRERIGTHGYRIGIVWQGNPDPRIDQGRSAPLSAFAPLAKIPNVRLISLQKGTAQDQIVSAPFADRIEQLGSDFDAGPDAFLDSAAAIECLDLVVSVDTSVAHLAGALNRPVYILLKRLGAHWAWLYGREESVWYPSAKLYRQEMPGDWTKLLERMATDVRALAVPRQTAGHGGAAPLVPVSVGELIDKLCILEIKAVRIEDASKRLNIEREQNALSAALDRLALSGVPLADLRAQLKEVNEALWEIEDQLRECERRKDFGPRFVELARSVYRRNDARARLKRDVNEACGSLLTEEKSYAPY